MFVVVEKVSNEFSFIRFQKDEKTLEAGGSDFIFARYKLNLFIYNKLPKKTVLLAFINTLTLCKTRVNKVFTSLHFTS